MTSSNSPRRAGLMRGAVAGAGVFIIFFLFFWAMAAAGSLPPAQGVRSLMPALLVMGIVGGVFGACAFGLYGFAREIGWRIRS